MNSSELARRAGVTVRALRHYHQVGVLDEPPRTSNGYRQYGVHDLIRVLRIRRLAALGITLEDMPNLLDEHGADTPAMLDRLDAELAAQIDRLTAQRALIAQLRDLPTTPDLPPELAAFMGTLSGHLSPELEQMDRDQTVLLAHLVGEEGMPHLVGYYEQLSDPELVPQIVAITAEFHRLSDETSEADFVSFVEKFVETFAQVVSSLRADAPELDLSDAAGLFDEYSESMLNETQQRAMAIVGERLDGPAA
ncbi:MerR family transcriptional regulator [Pseudoclavibacter sp. AY1F1]|uniref:MerR family transcriptional regulator n=1 Tax=Pseudoclavibacter sp. AY1F1 TaxID=2080583 RepID=UPI000CE8CB9B|nr:MerR family transcriptional regulator [Pseudoclavibacter sp. AY1F1]PPF45974.1 MerR family transcriptional regulator [Pseudoclavibacter sp. AY1F1]